MVLMIDNYDSFTYNLVQYFKYLGQEVVTYHNDKITINETKVIDPDYIVLSPGPGNTNNAGISHSVIQHFYQSKPILGVCLGHQCIAHFFGAKIIHAPEVMHGKVSQINHQNEGVFKNIPSPLSVTRYHSLAVDKHTLPECLTITTIVDETIMGIKHTSLPIEGIQFHPESVTTEFGYQMLENFLNYQKN